MITKKISCICLAWALAAAPLLGKDAEYKLAPSSTDVSLSHSTKILKEMSKGVGEVATTSKKALVYISVSKTMKGYPDGYIDPFELFGFGRRQIPAPKQEGLGSGFIVDLSKGYILTNNHVVEDADEINLKLANGESYKGKLLGSDPNTDIAVIKIDEKKFNKDGLAALVLGDSDQINVAEFVVALGAPFGLEASISFGVISATGRGSLHITQLGDFIQTDAAINPGNSGGPLMDMDGKVIGINTAILSKSGGYNGVGFAVPSNLVRKVADNIINGKAIGRGYIGVHFQPLSKEIIKFLKLPEKTKGVIVAQVEDDGPADKAGIKNGDVIIEVDGKRLEGDRDLVSRIGLMSPDAKVKITYLRDGKKHAATITIGIHPGEGQANPFKNDADDGTDDLGLYLEYKKDGLHVIQVERNSTSAGRVSPGDIILSLDNTDFTRLKNQDQALKAFKGAIAKARKSKQDSVILRVQRGRAYVYITVALPKK